MIEGLCEIIMNLRFEMRLGSASFHCESKGGWMDVIHIIGLGAIKRE